VLGKSETCRPRMFAALTSDATKSAMNNDWMENFILICWMCIVFVVSREGQLCSRLSRNRKCECTIFKIFFADKKAFLHQRWYVFPLVTCTPKVDTCVIRTLADFDTSLLSVVRC
jgi:hypothetical protein